MRGNDWSLMRTLMAEDVVWTLPGTSLLSGPAKGVDPVINRAQSLKKFGVMFQLQHILYGMEGVTLSLHNTASREDLILDEYVAIIFLLEEGKISSITTMLSDVEGINNFFVPGII
ncbi:nuclear transport factor 2 family protein [Mucilaginibacter sp. R11]|uniref:Nuclear transport factor 2 family protein n=2 Tax=Mucilaginibacter agri TaxID=2695265 RepID=A0A965ZGP7_9SPHI|nr:nuclear transport factor 2 family protein [Mucilaginibacter agri]